MNRTGRKAWMLIAGAILLGATVFSVNLSAQSLVQCKIQFDAKDMPSKQIFSYFCANIR